MKIDYGFLIYRLGLALLLFTATVLTLYLVGEVQGFMDSTLKELYSLVRWLSWGGLLSTLCLLVPMVRTRHRYLAASIGLAVFFAVIFGSVLFWGTWVYPDGGFGLW